MTRPKRRLKITDVAGNVGINRSPLSKAIRSVVRSEKASKKVRGMAQGRRRRST